LVCEVNVKPRDRRTFNATNKSGAHGLLDPLKFNGFTGYETRPARVFWYEYNPCHILDGTESLKRRTGVTNVPNRRTKIGVVGIIRLDSFVVHRKTVLLPESLSVRDCTGTVPWYNVDKVQGLEDS
jgi:hypothetical protein